MESEKSFSASPKEKNGGEMVINLDTLVHFNGLRPIRLAN